MRYVQNAPWPRDEVEKLRAWHEAGISQSDIARRLGRSPSSVASKVRQLGLPRRNPRKVWSTSEPREPVPERAGAVTLPPLPSLREP